MRSAALLVIAFGAFQCAARSEGSIITVNDFSGNETVVNFGNPATDTLFGTSTTFGGVMITANAGSSLVHEPAGAFSSFFANLPGASQQGTLRDTTSISNLVLALPGTVNRAGLLLSAGTSNSATWTVTAFDGATSLGSVVVSQPAAGNAVFAGLEFSQNITSLHVIESAGMNVGVTAIDDIRFEAISAVPEPAAVALLAITAIPVLLRKKSRIP